MTSRRHPVALPWPTLGLAVLAAFFGACGAGVGATPGSGGSGPVDSGGASGASNRAGGTSQVAGGGGTPAGGAGSPGSAGSTTASGGGSTGGEGGGAVGSTGGSVAQGGASTCENPTATGSLDVANVGTAPSGITQADLAGASPATHYYLSVPGNLPPAGTTDPAKQVGLFLVFHEHGSDPSVEIPSVTKALSDLKRSGDFVVLGLPIDPNTTTHPYTTDDHARAKLLLAYALKTWPINPRRVYLWGRGEGATMAHQWGTENKAAVAAMITYSWGWDSQNWPSNSANDEPDLYLVIGLADYPTTHVPLVRRVYGDAKAAGFKIIYREVPGLAGATAKAPTNDDAVAWAIGSRHKTQPLSAQETALLAPYADAGMAQGICPNAALFAGLELVGGTKAGHVMPGVLNASTEASRVFAAQLCGRANFGDEADTALATRLTDASAAVRTQAISSLGVAANWRDPAAQKALIDFATNASGEASARSSAVDALGVAAKYQIGGAVNTGGYQDPPLFLSLVTLLSDSDVNLRTKAFNILQPALTTTYDPTVSPAAQQSAIQAWVAWQKSLTG